MNFSLQEKMRQSEALLNNLTTSLTSIPEDLKIETSSIRSDAVIRPDIIIEAIPDRIPSYNNNESLDLSKHSNLDSREPQVDVKLESSDVAMETISKNEPEHVTNSTIEPRVKVKPPCDLQEPEILNVHPRIFNEEPINLQQSFQKQEIKDESPHFDSELLIKEELDCPVAPTEPADLSNKRPENLTCMPEIDYIKDEGDTASVSSASSDPERLEVDMSQVRLD